MSTFAAVLPLACVRAALKQRDPQVPGQPGIRPAAIYHRNVQNVHCGNGPLHGACHVSWFKHFAQGIGCYIGQDGTQRWPG